MATARAFGGLIPPQEALDRYLAALSLTPRGAEAAPLERALGRVLAQDVVATTDLPPFDRSAVDGWAVCAADTALAASDRPVVLRAVAGVAMGAWPERPLQGGEAMRIATGGVLPPGADAVVMQEHVEEVAGEVRLARPVRPEENVIERGADVRAGEVVLTRGRRLRPPDLGILASMGFAAVEVTLPPRVAIVATGDELVPPDAPLAPGRVRDANSVALAGAVQTAGGTATLRGIVQDDRAAVSEALAACLVEHEMVLVSGGSSVGERDVVVEAIGMLGAPGVIVHGVAVRPGKPTVLAALGGVPVIGLPGNPVSALVVFDLFARPVLEALMGMDPASRPWAVLRARLAAALPGVRVREDHRRVRLEARPDGIWAHPLPAGSQILTSLSRADGIVTVPPGDGFASGAEVEVRLLR